MMRHIVSVAFALVASTASAGWIEVPPNKYNKPNPAASIQHVSLAEIESYCGKGNLACSWPWGEIVLPHMAEVGERKYACLLRHEEAHTLGWRMSHFGGKQTRQCYF